MRKGGHTVTFHYNDFMNATKLAVESLCTFMIEFHSFRELLR